MSVSRREFAKSVAVAAALPLVPAASAAAESAAPSSAPVVPQQGQGALPSVEARGLGEYIRAKYGDRLSANDFDGIVRRIDFTLRNAARLNDPKLANGDEPFFVFRAYRSEG